MTKVIIDTNIYISAFIFGRKPQEIVFRCFTDSTIQVCISDQIFEEVGDKFLRGRVEAICEKSQSRFSVDNALAYLEYIKTNAFLVVKPIKLSVCNLLRDQKDQMFLDLASEVSADYIVSGDKDLLVLGDFQGTQIVTAHYFLEAVSENYI